MFRFANRAEHIVDRELVPKRHRHRAYVEAGVDFETVEWSGEYGTPLAFVLAENEVRRDLTRSQRAALAVEVKKRLAEVGKERRLANLKHSGEAAKDRFGNNSKSIGDSRKEAAEALGVNDRYVSDAERIQESSPQVFAEVKRGEKSIPQAKRVLGIDKPKAARKKKAAAEAEPAEPPAPASPLDEAAAAPTDGASLVDSAREDHQGIAAKRDELTDEEWLATLPLTSKLQGHAVENS